VEDRVGVAADHTLELALREVVLRAGADEDLCATQWLLRR